MIFKQKRLEVVIFLISSNYVYIEN